jgi:CxxC motif-containing protein (DUF1111 family)
MGRGRAARSVLACALAAAACAPKSDPPAAIGKAGFDASDTPIDGATDAQLEAFNHGEELFGTYFRDADGLGPLYIRASCESCHSGGTRGPGLVQKMVVVEADGFTPAADQSKLPFGHTVRPLRAAGAKTPLLPPSGDPTVKVTIRVGPPLLGHGYLDAILDSEIERVAAEQALRKDGIHGVVNRVVYESEPNPSSPFGYKKGQMVIGRFGHKARQASLDEFVADALQNDIGITSPMRPSEYPNPDGLGDDAHAGVDVTLDHVNGVAGYLRLLAIPHRGGLTDRGRALFAEVGCAACHVPSLKTRPDYPVPQLAGIDAEVYTDFLLHIWDESTGDGMTDGTAKSNQWRTAPLIGVRFNKTFLHDGRAKTIAQAIQMHSGEAAPTAARFVALPPADADALLDFVSRL